MEVKVEVVSKEMIKPSSPTPHHLRTHKLSFLDQIAQSVHVPLLLFYQTESDSDSGHDTPPHDHRAQKSQMIKQSLSDTLTLFYPLAGTITNNVSVDCNDAGAEYVEAHVHAQLSQIIEQPNIEDLKQYLPIEPYGIGTSREVILAVQINFFDCGGMIIGVSISHKIGDGSSSVTFLNAWAAKAHHGGDSSIMQPSFDMASYFPPRDHLSGSGSGSAAPTAYNTKQKVVTRRFVCNKTTVAILKETVSTASGSQVKDPTKVEVVLAYIWKHVMEMNEVNRNIMCPEMICVAKHAVNLRPRMSPPQSESSIGNLYSIAIALLAPGAEKEYHDLVSQLRRAIKEINSDYLKVLTDEDGYLDYLKRSREQLSKGEIEAFDFASWCGFPFYEVDYGWGSPIWVSTTAFPYKNLVILTSTRCGKGIEAWVTLLAEDMVALEREFPFTSYHQ